MISHESSFTMVIECKNNDIANIIAKSLEPENKQVDDKTTITMEIDDNKLILKLKSSSPISTLRNTADDIISTISTIESVYKSVKS
ncbi:MAG: CTAG/PCC1 family protein [Candidatus Heimdallarchaeota archaeon]|nr:CTAG/PCC1 family protein [Candidatus Heimdallarchaeota archaeon]